MIRSYNEMIRLKTFDERYNYLKLNGYIGNTTFGHHRHINQSLYTSDKWMRARDAAILRDDGRDLGIEQIETELLVHHINPLTPEQIEEDSYMIYDLNNLITTVKNTHSGIHYGNDDFLNNRSVIVRRKNDMVPWK